MADSIEDVKGYFEPNRTRKAVFSLNEAFGVIGFCKSAFVLNGTHSWIFREPTFGYSSLSILDIHGTTLFQRLTVMITTG